MLGRGCRIWQELHRGTEVILILNTKCDKKKTNFSLSLFYFRYYTSDFNPLVGIAHLKLGKIYPLLNEFQTALHHLREAGDCLKVTHGDQSKHMRDFVRPLLVQTQLSLEESQRIRAPVVDDEEDEEA